MKKKKKIRLLSTVKPCLWKMSCTLRTRKQVSFSQSLGLDLGLVSARTRELPNKPPYIVLKTYIDTFVKQWDAPTRNFFDFVKKELDFRVKELVAEHFDHYTHGRLKQDVM
jgi:hypothetical protein